VRVISGFEAALPVLRRRGPRDVRPVSDALKGRLRELFGTEDPEQAVRQILEDVQKRGDAALRDWTLRIDGASLSTLEVSKGQMAEVTANVSSELLSALKLAASRIKAFYEAQKRECARVASVRGGSGQLMRPLERVGLYVPGGTASYPSTVLMTAIPARVAGVKEVVLATPRAGMGRYRRPRSRRRLLPELTECLGSGCTGHRGARLRDGDNSCGGQDLRTGQHLRDPGQEAGLRRGGIDGLMGPSEVLIIADETASAEYCAAEMLARRSTTPVRGGAGDDFEVAG